MLNRNYAKQQSVPNTTFNWREETNNPGNPEMHHNFKKHICYLHGGETCNTEAFIIEKCKEKRVLDIGIVGHTLERTELPTWKHKLIGDAAEYVMGVDILEKEVQCLQQRGYNVKSVDATSDLFLGETFDIVHGGDIIEHVNNPVKLIEFAARHLSPQGEIILVTPNPIYLDTILLTYKHNMTLANMEHTCWITPTNLNELCFRSKTFFANFFYGLTRHKRWYKKLFYKFCPRVFAAREFIYIIKAQFSTEDQRAQKE